MAARVEVAALALDVQTSRPVQSGSGQEESCRSGRGHKAVESWNPHRGATSHECGTAEAVNPALARDAGSHKGLRIRVSTRIDWP